MATKKKTSKRASKPRARTSAAGMPGKTLPGAPKGKVSNAKLALGDAPVRAYIAKLPAKQRAIAQRFDALVARTLPKLERGIKWGMPFYGNEHGWFVSCGGFAGHVKITFLQGVKLVPQPPTGTGKYIRGVDVRDANDLDEAALAKWIVQAAKLPGFGAKPRKR